MMYSPVVVAGSNTHNTTVNMPSKITIRAPSSTQHVFKGIRELIVTDGSSAAPGPLAPAANSTTQALLAPAGVNGLRVGSGPTVTAVTAFKPYLKWLWSTSTNFKEYRVTRATLIVVGSVASTSTGNFNVVSSKDYHDIFGSQVPSYSTGPPGTSVASLANKDAKFPLTVDSRWKSVSPTVATILSDNASFIPTHTMEDLAFCYFAVSNNSTQSLGVCYLDYDIEFRGPINPLLNG